MFWTTARAMLAAAALAAGSSATASQDADVASRQAEKPGDETLTCGQLQAEMQVLDAEVLAMTKQVEKIATQQTSGAVTKPKVGNLAKQALSGLASTLIPGAGGLIGMGIDATSGSAMGGDDRAAGMMKALQPIIDRQTSVSLRMQRVGMLHADKCSASSAGAPQPEAQ